MECFIQMIDFMPKIGSPIPEVKASILANGEGMEKCGTITKCINTGPNECAGKAVECGAIYPTTMLWEAYGI